MELKHYTLVALTTSSINLHSADVDAIPPKNTHPSTQHTGDKNTKDESNNQHPELENNPNLSTGKEIEYHLEAPSHKMVIVSPPDPSVIEYVPTAIVDNTTFYLALALREELGNDYMFTRDAATFIHDQVVPEFQIGPLRANLSLNYGTTEDTEILKTQAMSGERFQIESADIQFALIGPNSAPFNLALPFLDDQNKFRFSVDTEIAPTYPNGADVTFTPGVALEVELSRGLSKFGHVGATAFAHATEEAFSDIEHLKPSDIGLTLTHEFISQGTGRDFISVVGLDVTTEAHWKNGETLKDTPDYTIEFGAYIEVGGRTPQIIQHKVVRGQ